MGLEQSALARVLGVTVDEIEAYETGAVRVRDAHLRELAAYFDVPIEYFLPRR
jgi:transcriptional regulator with XRE-family HTH domain